MTGKLETQNPAGIEKRSFEIITQELGPRQLDPRQAPIIKRCIHTSADSRAGTGDQAGDSHHGGF